MTPGQQLEFTKAERTRIRQEFAAECKRMLDEIATSAECVCVGRKSDDEHVPRCPVAVFRRAAHAVWMKAEP